MPYKLNKGIIYKIYNSGTSDKILNLIDQEGNKISALAKGVRKQTSKKASSIDLGNLVEVKTVEGYSLPIITEMKLIKEYSNFKKDFQAMIVLQTILEIIDHFAYENHQEKVLFDILKTTLDKAEPEKCIYSLSIFILLLLNNTGHLPDLERDLNTGEMLNSDNVYYLSNEPGYFSRNSNQAEKKLNPRLYKTQRFILSSKFEDSIKIKLENSENIELVKLHLNWLEGAISIDLKSKPILLSLIN